MNARAWIDRLLAHAAKAHAQHQLKRFLIATKDAAGTQARVLREKLARHAESEFARDHGLANVRDYAQFRERVPIRSYEELRPYVDRVVNGETRALLGRGQQVLMFAITSGTTDRPKHVPVTPEFLAEYRRGWNVFGLRALLDHPKAVLRPILQVVSPLDEQRTSLGVACGSISGMLAATQKRLVRRYYVLPPAVARIRDAEARYYTTMRLAIARDVAWMITASPATQLKLAKTGETHAESLIRDVADGTLRAPGEIPSKFVEMLRPRMMANAARAKELEAWLVSRGSLRPCDYWNVALLSNWMGGTMGLHLREFPLYYGDAPIRDIGLLATEGRVSIPLEDGTAAGVVDVEGSFFEFVESEAVGNDGGDSNLNSVGSDAVKRCHELEVGREYRVVMSTSAGLLRYDLGDYVRVHGFVGTAPVVEFLHRGAHVSSMTGEKLTEWQVTKAFERTCAAFGLGADTFVLAPVWGDPPSYRLFVETSPTGGGLQRLADRLDGELRELNVEYGSKRTSGRLGAVTACELRAGFLSEMDAAKRAGRGTSNEQFKHQFLYTRPGDDEALEKAARPGALHPRPVEAPRRV